MADDKNYYRGTFDRMEPDLAAIDTAAGWASIAISLKRIADALEEQNEPIISLAKETTTVEITPEMIETLLRAALRLEVEHETPIFGKFCVNCVFGKFPSRLDEDSKNLMCMHDAAVTDPRIDLVSGYVRHRNAAWRMRSPSGECGPDGKLWASK